MEKTITLRGKIKDNRIIELENDLLSDWKNQEVIVSIKKDKKNFSAIKEMLDEMKTGKNVGYVRIKREEIYK
jgi:predicted amino acid-binding ACT domain protein